MDNGFPILDAFNDDQAFERHFGSLLDDATNQLPDLDSGVLDDRDAVGGDDDLEALGQDLFDTGVVAPQDVGGYTSLPPASPGGPMLSQPHSTPKHGYGGGHGPGSVGSQPPPSPYSAPSPAQHQFTAPSPAPPPSPALQMKSPAPSLPPPQSPAHLPPPQSPANILYAKSPAAYIPPPSPRSSNATPSLPSPQPQLHTIQSAPVSSNSIFLSTGTSGPIFSAAAPAGSIVAGATVLTQPIQLAPAAQNAGAGQMFQLQLQPSVSLGAQNTQSTKLQAITSTQTMPLTPTKVGKQPQLLPKPSSAAPAGGQLTGARSHVVSKNVTGVVTSPAPAQPQQSSWITAGGQPGQQVIMGQVVQAAAAGQPAPLLIQQPQGNMMIIRPGGGQTVQTLQSAPTLVPVNGLGGQFIVQQPAGGQPATLAHQPNVKLITPQGRMQMQKIQTPTGPQLIAVPLGQTIIQGANGQLLAQAGQNIITNTAAAGQPGQIQFQAAPNIALSSAPILAASSNQAPGQGYTIQSQAQILNTPAAIVSVAGSAPAPTLVSMTGAIQPLGSLNSLGSGNLVTQQTVIHPNTQQIHNPPPLPSVTSSPVSPTKKKKPKKKKKDEDLPNKSQGVVDLGALMKDVGLDFGADDFGFGGLEPGSSQQNHDDSTQNLNSSLNSSQNSSSSDLEADLSMTLEQPPAVTSSLVTTSFAQFVSTPAPAATQLAQPSQQTTVQFATAGTAGGLRLATPLVSGQPGANNLVSGQTVANNLISGQTVTNNLVSGQSVANNLVTGPTVVNNLVSGQTVANNLLSGQAVATPLVSGQTLATPLISGQTVATPLVGGQTVANIATHQPQSLQLVQGPDGNFILQTNPAPAPNILGGQSTDLNSGLFNSASSSPATSAVPSPSPSSTQSKASPRAPVRSRNIADANRTPLFVDETLPQGWQRKVSQRKSGASAGRYEVFIIGPTGKRFRSRNELKSFFEKTNEFNLNPDDFDFSTFGRNNPKGSNISQVQTVSTSTPTTTTTSVIVTSVTSSPSMPSVVSTAASSSVTPATAAGGGLSESELIKNLENSAMASVAAARALEVGNQGLGMRNTLLQSIQQPLPQASLATPNAPASTTRPSAPPSIVLPPPNPGPSAASTNPQTKTIPQTPLSAAMEDAESQITLLLESLQKQQSGGTSVNSSSDQDFFDSLTPTGSAKTPDKTQVTPSNKGDTFSKPVSRYPSPSMPVLTPQVTLTDSSIRSPQDTSFQNKYLDTLARTQITDKRVRARHESGGMPMLSPTTGILHPGASPGGSPVSPRQAASRTSGSVIQAVPKHSLAMSGPPNVTVHSSSSNSPSSGSGMGGAGSQLRALQQLPPNTRLQHGPNGQVMIQKIQTIELSPSMQQQYKTLAQKISLIEQKAVKSPQDEADLAELQAKQHQILSTGRPVFAPQPQQPPLQPNMIAPGSAAMSTTPGIESSPTPRPGGIPGSSGAGVPPLTDQQRKIVAEFKLKIAKLAPDEQAAYIAQHKMDLIKQLNFQPNQIKILQNTQSQPQQPPSLPISAAPPHLRPPAPRLVSPVMVPHPQELTRPALIGHGPGPQLIQQRLMTPGIVNQLRPAPPIINNIDIARVATTVPAIDKSKRTAWRDSQLRKDQIEATQPNYKTPFRSREDTCKRLLRYHVYYEDTMDENDMIKADKEFEKTSETLLARYQVNLSKYHLLLLDESTRMCSSSCEAMLGRMWVAEEKASLAKEKEDYRSKCNRFIELDRKENLTLDERLEHNKLADYIDNPELPPIPDSWAEKYEQIVGKSWESYKLKHKRDESVSETSESPDPDDLLEEEDKDLEKQMEIKKEPKDHESDIEMSFRERHSSSNSELFLERARSRNSSNGTNASRKDVRVNLANILDPSQARKEFNELTKSFRPPSVDLLTGDKNFVGLKFNRSMSGRWSASLKRDAAELSDHGDVEQKKMKVDQDFDDDSSDDEDFSLADVGGNNAAVQSMLENDDDCDDLDQEDDELRFDNPSRMSLDTFDHALRYNPSPGILNSDSRDNDSVNNAINSILDFDRGAVQTPDDLKNLTGLLDAAIDDTQNAVNSIL